MIRELKSLITYYSTSFLLAIKRPCVQCYPSLNTKKILSPQSSHMYHKTTFILLLYKVSHSNRPFESFGSHNRNRIQNSKVTPACDLQRKPCNIGVVG